MLILQNFEKMMWLTTLISKQCMVMLDALGVLTCGFTSYIRGLDN